ncbi:hypothetical protein V8E54_003187 [Elaphomyces granulatus]
MVIYLDQGPVPLDSSYGSSSVGAEDGSFGLGSLIHSPGPRAVDYLFGLTNGHPAAVGSILSILKKVYRSAFKHRENDAIQKAHVIKILDNEEQSFQYLLQTPMERYFVSRQVFPEVVVVLREALLNGNVERNLERPGIKECYQKGWLHSEALDVDMSEIVLAFPIHLRASPTPSSSRLLIF